MRFIEGPTNQNKLGGSPPCSLAHLWRPHVEALDPPAVGASVPTGAFAGWAAQLQKMEISPHT